MKHYTSIEQSKHLLKLGLNPESADMSYFTSYKQGKLYRVYHSSFAMNDKRQEGVIPCWSLGALLEVMPNAAMREYNLVRNSEECYIAFDDVNKRIHENYEGNTPLEAAYNMVVWLLENGYIEKGKKDALIKKN